MINAYVSGLLHSLRVDPWEASALINFIINLITALRSCRALGERSGSSGALGDPKTPREIPKTAQDGRQDGPDVPRCRRRRCCCCCCCCLPASHGFLCDQAVPITLVNAANKMATPHAAYKTLPLVRKRHARGKKEDDRCSVTHATQSPQRDPFQERGYHHATTPQLLSRARTLRASSASSTQHDSAALRDQVY